MNLPNKWIWCQYTPGAGGKMISVLLQLDKKIHPWHIDIRENFKRYVERTIKIPPANHTREEPIWPYDLSWFTRQLPFTRGDDLSAQQAEKLFTERNQEYDNPLIKIMHWNKPYLPDWFEGRTLTIVNDEDSMDFLKKRRDAIFYSWSADTVTLKRFVAAHVPHSNLVSKFDDHPLTEKTFKNIQEFYREEFYEHPEVFMLCKNNDDNRVKMNLNLSDLWKRSGSQIAMEINDKFSLDIDLEKADFLVASWLENNQHYL